MSEGSGVHNAYKVELALVVTQVQLTLVWRVCLEHPSLSRHGCYARAQASIRPMQHPLRTHVPARL